MSINIKKTELESPSKNFDYAHNIAYDYIGYEGEEYVQKDLKIFKDSYSSILQIFKKLNENERIYLKTLFQLFVNYLEMNWVIKLSKNKSFECFPKKRLTKKSIQINLKKSKQRNIRKYTNLISTVQSPKSKPSKTIFEIISSGEELHKHFQKLKKLPENERILNISKLIQPKVFLADQSIDKITGNKLSDIWTYLRLYWTMPFESTPGRTMPFIIRNMAFENMPVIGIGMLASPVLRLTVRDSWIGWTLNALHKKLFEEKYNPSEVIDLFFSVLFKHIDNTYYGDLPLNEKIINNPKIENIVALDKMFEISERNRQFDIINKNSRYTEKPDLSNMSDEEIFKWTKRPLFKKKRSSKLSKILEILRIFEQFKLKENPKNLFLMFKVDFGRSAISYVLDLIRVDGLSSEVADLSICGAIPPYNEILCGKLTCLISGSQEIQDMYKKRYGNTISEISTFTAGKAIFRDVNLKVLTTTSLYGRSSQYNRIKILKNKENNLKNDLIWNHLGSTKGYGVFHFDEKTTELLQKVYEIKNGYRNVNCVFGEGTSPKLRKIKDGLSILKIDGDTGLKHGQARDSYATELFNFAREELIFKRLRNSTNSKDSINNITYCWIKRWLVRRIENEEVMQRLKYSGKSKIIENI